MNPMLNIAIQAIRKAGNFIIKQYELFNKKNENINYIYNFVHNTHKESNRIIESTIHKFYPLHTIMIAYKKNNTDDLKHTSDTCWIINSIDNNVNFIKQFPLFALSIAVKHKNHIEIGVIYDPVHNELFSACRGRGAQLNGYRIRVGTAKNLRGSILAISCSQYKQQIIINLLKKLCNQHINFRCTGTITLDLVYIAVGRIDGCFAIFPIQKINILISSILIIQEAGGLVTEYNDESNTHTTATSSKKIIAGNHKITKSLSSII